MARNTLTRVACALLAVAVGTTMAAHADDDTGLIVGATVEKKINKKASTEAEVEFRSRHDFRTADRVSLGVSGEYKLASWLKASAGYQLLICNNQEKISYKLDDDGTTHLYNKWRPSFWGLRHRANAALTASIKWRRVSFSLREAYRYTYRPATTTTRYDFDNAWWEDTRVKTSHQHVLRSRLKAQWDIPKCKFTPWVSGELFNNMRLDKVRLQAGVDYAPAKQHTFGLYYRFQYVCLDEEEEPNAHHIGLSYKFKF